MIDLGKPDTAAMILAASKRFGLAALLAASATIADAQGHPVSLPLSPSRVDPKEFGLLDDTITTISAWSFSHGTTPDVNPPVGDVVAASANLGRFNSAPENDAHFYAALDLPAGSVIDYIGVNSAADAPGLIGCALWTRDSGGSATPLAVFSIPPHDWSTDLFGPLGILVDTHQNRGYILELEQASSPNYEYFGWVEIWWRRSVSPPPASPSFGDVPTTDLGYQYIEALAASGITGGCGAGNYCPNANLSRRQMAIFLAKALGLHWPN